MSTVCTPSGTAATAHTSSVGTAIASTAASAVYNLVNQAGARPNTSAMPAM